MAERGWQADANATAATPGAAFGLSSLQCPDCGARSVGVLITHAASCSLDRAINDVLDGDCDCFAAHPGEDARRRPIAPADVTDAAASGLRRPVGIAADLCQLWQGGYKLRADAAVSLAVLNQAFVARFGADLCLASGYRTLSEQVSVKAQKGGLAAAPGKSNHGWGLAVDFCSQETNGARWTWLNENAPSYGWDNPAWARAGGSGPYERWHWEYTQGVMDDGEFYG